MQSLAPKEREALSRRRSRIACRFCGRMVELARLRGHLRDVHQVGSTQIEQFLADARRTAVRSRRGSARAPL